MVERFNKTLGEQIEMAEIEKTLTRTYRLYTTVLACIRGYSAPYHRILAKLARGMRDEDTVDT